MVHNGDSVVTAGAGSCRFDLGADARIEFHQISQCAFLLARLKVLDPAGDPGSDGAAFRSSVRSAVRGDVPETPMGGSKRCHDRFLWLNPLR